MARFRFCSNCGVALSLDEGPQVCGHCGAEHYEHSCPCAGALVVKGGWLLLVKRGVDPYKGCWDIPGGFLEAGEHPEDGAVREVQEETGLKVEMRGFFGAYIDTYGQGGDYTLNLFYLAEPIGGKPRPASDAQALAWFPPGGLPEPLAFSHIRQVLEDWRRSIADDEVGGISSEVGDV